MPKKPRPSGTPVAEALQNLSQPNAVRFIFGERQARANLCLDLVASGLGEILHLWSDPSLFARACETGDREGFWWTLIAAAMGHLGSGRLFSGLDVRALTLDDKPRTLLLNAPEFSDAFIEALIRVHAMIETNPALRARITLVLFLDHDVKNLGFENFEQQRHGKSIDVV
jgi:hypothetical protein